jgi:translation initiation factor IF-1
MPSKRSNNSNTGLITREGSGEAYALANLPVGDGQFRVFNTETGLEMKATIRGSLRRGKNNKIVPGKLVLLQRDDSSTKEKWFIIHVYSDDDVKRLRKSGEIVDIKEKEVSNVVFVDESTPNIASNQESDDEDDQDFIDDI